MSESLWRVLDGEGNEQGPYSFQDLQSFYTTGNINHETMIWTEGLEQWVPAGQVEGLLPDIPQVVELAPAAVLTASPVAQPSPAQAPVAGLAPAMPGVPEQPGPQGLPTWINIVTVAIGAIAVILFFLPWVSISVSESTEKNSPLVETVTQSGLQSITQDVSMADEFKEHLKKGGATDEDIEKMEEKDGDEEPFDKSTLVLSALIAVGLGTLLALIGFANQMRALTISAQGLFIIGAILIGIQMAQQFPMIQKFAEEQKKMEETLDEIAKASKDTLGSLADAADAVAPDTKVEGETVKKGMEKEKKELDEAVRKQKIQLQESSKTSFKPSCFVVMGLLGCSLLLIVVTMSHAEATPLIIPQPGSSPQPGGIKFH